jgi:hypothetical protein
MVLKQTVIAFFIGAGLAQTVVKDKPSGWGIFPGL